MTGLRGDGYRGLVKVCSLAGDYYRVEIAELNDWTECRSANGAVWYRATGSRVETGIEEALFDRVNAAELFGGVPNVEIYL